MAKINLTEDVLKHTDEEIIDYLASEARTVRNSWKKALEAGDLTRFCASAADLEIMVNVLIALDGRNKNRDIQ